MSPIRHPAVFARLPALISATAILILSCGGAPLDSPDRAVTADPPGAHSRQAAPPMDADRLPDTFLRLRRAYPDGDIRLVDGTVYVGSRPVGPWDDGLVKSPQERLDGPDVEDQLHEAYPGGEPLGEPDGDPGRVRNAAFFAALYGADRAEVEAALETVVWLPGVDGTRLRMNARHGAADALRAVSDELVRRPSLLPYLRSPAGAYNFRTIAGTSRLSAHAWGIAVDLNLDHADYWRWAGTEAGRPAAYRNRIPGEVVEVFERHGFIWGGRWRHFDTMHFEYRPELAVPDSASEILGESVEGSAIEVFRFGRGPQHLVLVGGIHGGYEWNTVDLLWDLVEHWSRRGSQPPPGTTLHLIPEMNSNSPHERRNPRGVDLNRNWPGPTWTEHPPAGNGVLWAEGGPQPLSEPETRAVADYLMALAAHTRTVRVQVVVYHALLRPGLYEHRGLTLPGYRANGQTDPASRRAAGIYARAVDYDLVERFDGGYETTGEAILWAVMQGMQAFDVELPDTDTPHATPLVYDLSHFQATRIAVDRLLHDLSAEYTAFLD